MRFLEYLELRRRANKARRKPAKGKLGRVPRLTTATLLALLVFTPAAAAGGFTEDFEDDTDLQDPTSPHYAFLDTSTGGQNVFVTTTTPKVGAKSLYFTGSGATARFDAAAGACDGFTFELYFTTIPSVTVSDAGQGANSPSLIVGYDQSAGGGTGHIYLTGRTAQGNGAAYQSTLGTITNVNARYDSSVFKPLQLEVLHCRTQVADSTSTRITLGFPDDGDLLDVTAAGYLCDTTYNTATHGPACGLTGRESSFDRVTLGSSGRVDALTWGGIDVQPQVNAEALVEIPDTLTGFDVDTFGSTVIVRTGPDRFVRTYTGNTLEPIGSFDTACTTSDRVLVQTVGGQVAFLRCDEPNQERWISVRSATLAAPVFPSCEYCDPDIDFLTYPAPDGVPQELGEIHETALFPVSFIGNGRNGVLFDWRHAAIGYSRFDGKVGVLAYTNVNNGPDVIEVEERGFSAGQTPSQVCGVAVEGVHYLAAAHASTQTHVYRVDLSRQRRGVDDVLVPELSGPAYFDASVGVACGYSDILVETADQGRIISYDRNGGTFNWQVEGVAGAPSRGVALSGDENWYAFVDGDQLRIGNATNGNTTCTFPLPSGEFFAVELSEKGQNAYVAMTETGGGRVARYRTTGCTTVTPLSDTAGLGALGGLGPGSAGSDGAFIVGSGAAGKVVGCGGGCALFASFATILALALLGFRLTGGSVHKGPYGTQYEPGSPLVIGGAAYLGMWLSVYAWDFWLVVPVAIGILAIALIVQRFWGPHA